MMRSGQTERLRTECGSVVDAGARKWRLWWPHQSFCPAGGRIHFGPRPSNGQAVVFLVIVLVSLPSLRAQTLVDAAPKGLVSSGDLSPRVRRDADRGPVDSGKRLPHMTLTLRRSLEQHAALDQLLGELQDPSSPVYHKWLTPEGFGERFGASAADLNRIRDWLRSQGFAVESTAPPASPEDAIHYMSIPTTLWWPPSRPSTRTLHQSSL